MKRRTKQLIEHRIYIYLHLELNFPQHEAITHTKNILKEILEVILKKELVEDE